MNPTIIEAVTLQSGLHWDFVFGGAFLLLLAGVAVYATAIPQGDRRWWGLIALLAVLVTIGQVVGAGVGRLLLLDAAAFVAVALVWMQGTSQARAAARNYLALLLLAVVFLAAGLYLGGEGHTPPQPPVDKAAVGLLVVGFGLKLALLPFYFWLPGLAEHAKPMTTALVVSVVDIAAFGELAHLRLAAPWVFTDYATLWLALALLSMYGGALLALAQRNLKRMLAYSTIDDMGYLLLGVVVGSEVGLSGAILAALSHAFFKVLLFGSVGLAESQTGRDLTLDDRGLAARYPVSAAVFIISALGMIGVPPLFGFVGRWRLYLAGVEYGGLWLALAMAVATGLALLYYVRAIHRVWLGQGQTGDAVEPRLPAGVLVGLTVVVLILGLYPGWIISAIM
ncbi:MAG: proton-conducting transporter membrane subunit [Chloroflexota bacterium]